MQKEALDTLNTLRNGYYYFNGKQIYIGDDIQKSYINSRIYNSDADISNAIIYPHPAKYTLFNCTTTTAIEILNYKGLKDICFLNFASAIKAGGGWLNGRIAQEEDIMRKTTGFISIVNQNDFYNHKNTPFYSSDIIYSPDVLVIKNSKFDYIEPINVSMITSAAVNVSEFRLSYDYSKLNAIQSWNMIEEAMRERIKRILLTAIDNEQKNIVLGAFGCGVFGNDACMIANIFKETLVNMNLEYYFQNIVFAIYEPNGGNNILEFEKAFNLKATEVL